MSTTSFDYQAKWALIESTRIALWRLVLNVEGHAPLSIIGQRTPDLERNFRRAKTVLLTLLPEPDDDDGICERATIIDCDREFWREVHFRSRSRDDWWVPATQAR